MLKPALALSSALALVGAGIIIATPAQATSYNWGNPPNVCDQVSDNYYQSAYEQGMCAPAISPQQTVKGTTSLQYMVSCQDAPTSSVGTYGNTGPYWQSVGWLAFATNDENYSKTVAWTTGSTVVSGEAATGSAYNGSISSTGAVQSWGTTPVKVYNGEVAWDSTSVTFAAGCANSVGNGAWNGTEPVTPAVSAAADVAERHVVTLRAALAAAVERTVRDFATGERKRAEYQVRAKTATGVEVHDRINLKAGKAERTTLMCPRGMLPSGDPQTSYGFDALKDVSGYEPRITAKRAWSKRGVTLSYSAGKLKYPTVAYTVLPCGKSK